MGAKLGWSIGVGMFLVCVLANAAQPAQSVVSVQYKVREQVAEKLEAAIMNPFGQMLRELDRVKEVISMATHGRVEIEIAFEDETTQEELMSVMRQAGRLVIDDSVGVMAMTIEIRPARLADYSVPTAATNGGSRQGAITGQ